ncbi:MAG TPA: hypothetical protein VLS89_15055, partial [Candidatus Nanopelagicales bacterium]|nr:hypothetical protein [Candidatus Nanopelagicales bacterium]
VDLVYLDPPFQSGKAYAVSPTLKKRSTGARPVLAFDDTWRWGGWCCGACGTRGRPGSSWSGCRGGGTW